MTNETETENQTAIAPLANEAQNIQAEAANFDKILKFRKGRYFIGDDEVAIGTEYLAHVASWVKVWVKFQNNKLVERRMFRVALGERPPQREELDDCDPDTWKRGPDGKPADPWQLQHLLPFENLTSGEVVIFTTSSMGGRSAVSELATTYARRKQKGQNGQPIVQLAAGEMKTRNFGAVARPVFEVVGWDYAADVAIPEMAAVKVKAATGQHDDMDDEIPF
jgi:hypothetical protein